MVTVMMMVMMVGVCGHTRDPCTFYAFVGKSVPDMRANGGIVCESMPRECAQRHLRNRVGCDDDVHVPRGAVVRREGLRLHWLDHA